MKNITFKQQAEKFLTEGATRKRNPLRPGTLRTYRTQIDSILIPMIGKTGLHLIGNKVVSEIVQKMSEQGYSARTIALNITIIKKIRKSAVTENGDQMFPYEWNTDVIDAPTVTNDKKATVSAQELQDAISHATGDRKALYALLAGTGLRIGEVLGLILGPVDSPIGNQWLPGESKLLIRGQITRTGWGPVKTSAGVREIDLSPALNNYLQSILIDRQPGIMLFTDCENCYRDSLEKDGIEGGFHSLRRFRVTHLRLQGVPDAIVKFWIGHAAGNVTEQYTQVGGEIEARKQWAEKAGLGFEL